MINNLSEYINACNKLDQSISQEDHDDINHEDHKDYLLVKASHRFLLEPKNNEFRDEIEYRTFFKKWLLNIRLLQIDSDTNYHVLQDMIQTKGDVSFLKDIKENPRIFCSFHYGAYIQLAVYLKLNYVDLHVVMSQEFNINGLIAYDVEKEKYVDSNVESVQSNSWSSLLEISNKLRQGKSVLIFIDRTDGISNKLMSNKLHEIFFFNRSIQVRGGIPEVAYSRKTPIIPVFSTRNSFTKIELEFHEEISTVEDENKKDFTKRLLQKLYNIVESHILLNPTQWEYWNQLYHLIDVNKSILNEETSVKEKPGFVKNLFNFLKKEDKVENIENTNIISNKNQLKFNDRDFAIFKEIDQYYIFNIFNFNCFKITKNLYTILSNLNTENPTLEKLESFVHASLLQDLIKQKVIISL